MFINILINIKKAHPPGLESRISALGGQRRIHWARRAKHRVFQKLTNKFIYKNKRRGYGGSPPNKRRGYGGSPPNKRRGYGGSPPNKVVW